MIKKRILNNQDIIYAIKKQKVLPLFYHEEEQVCIAVTKALYDGGIRCIEFTNRGEKALSIFKSLIKERNTRFPDLLLAIGTIKTKEDANNFIDAGADCLISPVFDPGIASVAFEKNKLWIPGCMTPTEINRAQQAGCSIIKLFPGNVLGTAFIEAIKPLFSGLDYIVTGGVDATLENLRSWFKAGAAAVGLGSKLITKELLQSKDFDRLITQTSDLLKIAQSL